MTENKADKDQRQEGEQELGLAEQHLEPPLSELQG
jgi:hypothetical protein